MIGSVKFLVQHTNRKISRQRLFTTVSEFRLLHRFFFAFSNLCGPVLVFHDDLPVFDLGAGVSYKSVNKNVLSKQESIHKVTTHSPR